MKPIFTVHIGEFLVGDRITRKCRGQYEVWVPATDTGVDLLVTRLDRRDPPVALQVKSSRAFDLKGVPPEHHWGRGWYTLNMQKAERSRANWWTFVVTRTSWDYRFIVVPHTEVLRRINSKSSRQHFYLAILQDGRCFATRGLKRAEVRRAVEEGQIEPDRDWTQFVDAWDPMLPKM